MGHSLFNHTAEPCRYLIIGNPQPHDVAVHPETVFKKRLNDNMHRSIVLAKRGQYWVYEYLFAKKDRDNIDDDELAAFRSLAKGYAGLTELQIDQLAGSRHFVEICYDDKA